MLVDLDDTILDDTGRSDALWREVCTDASSQLPGVSGDSLFAAIDKQRRWYWSDAERHRVGRADLRAATTRIVEAALADLDKVHPNLAVSMAHRYRDLRDAHLALFPGAVETLAALRAAGVRLAMLTNGAAAPQRLKIERFQLAPYFDAILVEGELGFGKPDRRVYQTALQALNTTPASTWCIGDNLEWDVGAPQREGVYGIWVDGQRRGLPETSAVRPDRIVHSLAEILG